MASVGTGVSGTSTNSLFPMDQIWVWQKAHLQEGILKMIPTVWWDGPLERSFKQWGHYLEQRSTNIAIPKNTAREKVSIWTPAPIESILTTKRNFLSHPSYIQHFCFLYLSSLLHSPLPQKAKNREWGKEESIRGGNEKDRLHSSSHCTAWNLSQAGPGGEKSDCMRLWNFDIRQD